MNCFEAQRMFVAFWRRNLAATDRAAFSDHLRGCARCDRGFRVFALSAPVVHGLAEPVPSAAGAPLAVVRSARAPARRFSAAARPPPSVMRPWAVAAAALLMLLVGGFSAWSVATVPTPDFSAAVAGDDSDVVPVRYSLSGIDSATDNTDAVPALFDALAPDAGSAGMANRAG